MYKLSKKAKREIQSYSDNLVNSKTLVKISYRIGDSQYTGKSLSSCNLLHFKSFDETHLDENYSFCEMDVIDVDLNIAGEAIVEFFQYEVDEDGIQSDLIDTFQVKFVKEGRATKLSFEQYHEELN